VSDVITTARTARESLARALNALQADPNAPPQLMELAAPIAQAMGALMNIERTGQIMPHADVAVNNVRTALQSLQQAGVHPSVGQAMEAVASSLGLVHSLWRMGQPQAPQPAAPPPQPAYAPAPQAAPAPIPAARPQAAPVQQRAYENAATMAAAPGQVPYQGFPAPAPAPVAAPPRPGPPAGDLALVNADLGTQSPTNFYKGLSGNDIIDHGGLFVSTYMVPKIGTSVRLKVSLPGGYEFEANAVVAWSREASDGGGDGAPPGFGARFTQITPEARQLIYRYVRNREPLFHDDL
jgi:uncharacterized protein (TIGR02266 family)